MRLMPGIASTGPWYVVYPIRLVYAAAFFLALFWPYTLPDARPNSYGSALAPVVTAPLWFLVQRHQIEQRSGRTLARCREVIRRLRRGEPAEDPAELAAVAAAVRPQLQVTGARWGLAAVPLLVAVVELGIHADDITRGRWVAAGWAVLSSAALFALATRAQRTNRQLRDRLDAALAG